METNGGLRATATSDRSWRIVAQKRRHAKTCCFHFSYRLGLYNFLRCRPQLEASRHHTCIDISPERDDQFARERYNHRVTCPLSVQGTFFIPNHKIALGLELQHPPR